MAMELARDSEEFEYEKVIVNEINYDKWQILKANYHEIKTVGGSKRKAIKEANNIGRYVEIE